MKNGLLGEGRPDCTAAGAWRKPALAVPWLVLWAALAGPVPASAQSSPSTGGRASARATPVNPIAALAGQLRATRCANMARSVGEQVVGANPSAGVVLSPASGADESLFSASVETRDGVGMHFVSAYLAPNARGGCDAGYDDIRYWAKACDKLAIEELKDAGTIRPLGPDVSTLVAGPLQHIYLMAAGPGCVSIRKELMY